MVRYRLGFQLSSASLQLVHRPIHSCGEPQPHASGSFARKLLVPPGKFLASDAELYEAAHRRIKNDKTSLTTNLSLINEGAVAILLLTLWRLKIRVVIVLTSTPVLGRETNQSREWRLGPGRWNYRHPGRSRSFDKAHDHS